MMSNSEYTRLNMDDHYFRFVEKFYKKTKNIKDTNFKE